SRLHPALRLRPRRQRPRHRTRGHRGRTARRRRLRRRQGHARRRHRRRAAHRAAAQPAHAQRRLDRDPVHRHRPPAHRLGAHPPTHLPAQTGQNRHVGTERNLMRPMRLAVLTAVLALGAAACGGTTKSSVTSAPAEPPASSAAAASADPNAPIKPGLKLAFLPKQINNPYMTIVAKAGEEAAAEFQGEAKEVGPSDASASSQISYINTLTQQGHDAILISANDPNAVCGPLNQAREKGITIVSYDSDAAPECRDLFINQARSEEIGRSQIQLLAEMIGHKGEIAILSATANATNQNTWIEFIKDELTKPEYKDMELVKVAYGD